MIGCGGWGSRNFLSWNRCYNSLGRENSRSMLDGRSRNMNAVLKLMSLKCQDIQTEGLSTQVKIPVLSFKTGKKCKWKHHMHISNAETCHKRCVQHQRLCCKVENVKESWQKRRDTWVECHIWLQNLQFLVNWIPDNCLPNK